MDKHVGDTEAFLRRVSGGLTNTGFTKVLVFGATFIGRAYYRKAERLFTKELDLLRRQSAAAAPLPSSSPHPPPPPRRPYFMFVNPHPLTEPVVFEQSADALHYHVTLVENNGGDGGDGESHDDEGSDGAGPYHHGWHAVPAGDIDARFVRYAGPAHIYQLQLMVTLLLKAHVTAAGDGLGSPAAHASRGAAAW